jgi:hypothetical protein
MFIQRIVWALNIQILVRAFAFFQMLGKCVFGQGMVWVVWTLEHLLVFDGF